MPSTRRSLRDPLTAVLGFGIGLYFFLASREIGGSGMFPGAVAAIMMLTSAVLFAKGIVRPSAGEPMSAHDAVRLGVTVALTLLYIVGVRQAGFVTSSLLFIPLVCYTLGLRRHVTIVATTLAYVLGVYFFFEVVFSTPLPRDVILRLLAP